jgi:hypothetical protein
MHKNLLAAAALLAVVLPAAAQSTMKPGLWEINNKMSGGQVDKAMAQMQEQMAKMPPDQRRMMEDMMAKRGVRMVPGGVMSVQVCMTKEMAERNEVPTREGCTSNKQQRSGNTIHVTFSCTKPPSSGEGDVSFTPETYTSHMTIKTQRQGKEETLVADANGKWLKADCGDIKPAPQAK